MFQQLIDGFYQSRNNERAVGMSAYMKNHFPFLGIPKPERILLQQALISHAKKSVGIDWESIFHCWNLPEREFQYLAVDYVTTLKNRFQKDDMKKLKTLIITKSWWDTVDSLAANCIGAICATYPELIESHIVKWANAENLWLVRVAILFQLKYKEQTNAQLLAQIIQKNSSTKEFFINKAIGWSLREYSKTNPAWVKNFIEHNKLHTLSVREGSKYLT